MNAEDANRRFAELFDFCRLPEFPNDQVPLVIYGAGNCGKDALRVLRQRGREVAAFLDERAASIGSIGGLPCFSPESEAAAKLASSECAILIAVYNFTADPAAIQERLSGIGFSRFISYMALDAQFPGELASRFWLESRTYWEENRPNLLAGLALWDDSRSREIYLDLVELRLSGKSTILRNPDRSNQYFPPDLPLPRNPLRFVDGGAFTGDTIAELRRFQPEAIAAFEPDRANFEELCRTAERELMSVKELVLLPCGLDRATEIKSFCERQDAGSTLAEEGLHMVQVVALDDVLPNFSPTFIKLDIEGAELDALLGATRTIRRHGPRIAACLYHRPDHLWKIPQLLRELLPSHRLCLRYHGYSGFDAVAYAIEE